MISEYILNNYPALGTYFWIETFEDLSPLQMSKISERLKKEIIDFEYLYSRFKKDSLISHFNSFGEILNAPYDLVEMVKISLQIAKLTNDTFNICLLNQLEDSGYDSELSFKEKISRTSQILPTSEVVTIESNNLFLKEGYRIDLGGIGKGYLIDKLSKILLNDFGIKYFLINGGGDIYLTSDNEEPVEINLQNPCNNSEFIGSIFLKNQALCGSSPFKRQWVGDRTSKKYFHIIDPKNNSQFNSSFVAGENAVICDTLATALCIDAECLLGLSNVTYLVVGQDGQVIKNTF
jgi:thiamine biosynthesis lipoprotein